MPKRYLQKFSLYARLPEMRLFWFSLVFFVFLLTIDILYLPGVWVFIAAGIFVVLTVIILTNSFRLAYSNLEVKAERNELKSIIFNLRDGVIAYDPNFKILIFNHSAEAIFNLRSEDVIGKSFSPDKAQDARFRLFTQVIFPSLAPVAVRRSDVGVYPHVIDLSFADPDIELRVTTDRVIDPQGQLFGFMKIIHDRTREVKLIRSKTEFISVAAHQLRSPMTAVHWSLESLMKQSLPSVSEQELVNTAYAAASKALKTINDLLDVSKIEEGQFGYKFENVNIVDFVEGVIKDVAESAKKFGIKIYFAKPLDSSIAVTIDSSKMGIVLFNLLDNAVRYNVKNGEVAVKVEKLKDEPYIKISVKDTGIGISPDAIKKLFTKFFRADNAIRFYPDGLGLGLYIVKNIVKRHGGEVWAESELNRGTTFSFTIPTDSKLIPPKEIAWNEEE